MSTKTRRTADRSTSRTVEKVPGIMRTTLAYNEQVMLCHFMLERGAAIPLHDHPAVQAGYVISGRLKLSKDDGTSFVAESGSAYAFEPSEVHGAEALEDAEIIECFSPMRPEYADE